MKLNHDYFKNYNTRKVQFRKSTGLFVLDGEPVPRSVLEDESKSREVVMKYGSKLLESSTQLVYTPGLQDISPLRRHHLLQIAGNITSPQRLSHSRATTRASTSQSSRPLSRAFSPPRSVLNEMARLEAARTCTPVYQVLENERVQTPKQYSGRLKTPQYEVVTDYEKAVHEAKAEFHTHIYHDNNFAQIYKQQQDKNAAERLWNAREKNIRDLRNSWTSEVRTETPTNTKVLGLTPLRQYGNGQDKPHHIPKTHNVLRMDTTSRPSTANKV